MNIYSKKKQNKNFLKLIFSKNNKTSNNTLVINYSKPFRKTGLIGWLSSSSDRWIILLYLNEKILGQYLACYQIGFYFISQISAVLTSFLHPITTSLNLKEFGNYKKLMVYCFYRLWRWVLYLFCL